MLDPDLVMNSVLDSFRSIPQLVTEVGGAQNITGHYYYSGEENSLMKTLGQMRAPTILLAYLAMLGGNFDGQTMWKHQINLYVRPRNKASDALNGRNSASAPHLYWMALNLPITVPRPADSIRYIDLVDENLMLMETPSLLHQVDELGQDFFYSTLTFVE